MTYNEAIKILESLKAEIEWDYSLDYQIVIDEAIEAIKEMECKDVGQRIGYIIGM